MSAKLTGPQRDMLALLANQRSSWFTCRDLLRLLYQNHATPEGAAATASSLVRRGLAHRCRDLDGRVCYSITAAGIASAGQITKRRRA